MYFKESTWKIKIFYVYLDSYNFWCSLFFPENVSFIWYNFSLYWKNFFSISYNADVLVTDFCIFLLFENSFILFHTGKNYVHRIQNYILTMLFFFFFLEVKVVKMLFHCLLKFIFSNEKSEIIQIVVLLYVVYHFSFPVFKIFSFYCWFSKWFCSFLILLWVHWAIHVWLSQLGRFGSLFIQIFHPLYSLSPCIFGLQLHVYSNFCHFPTGVLFIYLSVFFFLCLLG